MTRKESIYMKSGFISFLGILTVLLSSLPFSTTASDRFPNPAAPDFPIAAWKAFPLDVIPTDRDFNWVKEAGINIVSQTVNDTALMPVILDLTDRHGLKMVFRSDYLSNVRPLPSIVKRLKGHHALLGYYIHDEPEQTYEDFQFCIDRDSIIKSIDPSVLRYINLWAHDNEHAPDYTEYIDDFVKAVRPQIISTDIYPIRGNNSIGYHEYEPQYQTTLEILYKKSKQYNLPWMICCQATALPDFKYPDYIYMRYQAFRALAYGAQAICWWTYNHPNRDYNRFLSSPIVNGERTTIWYDLKKINQEIQRYKEVFLDCKIVGVALVDTVTSSSSSYKVSRINTSPLYASLANNKNLEIYWKDGNTVYTKGYLISQIRNNGHEYLVIVSQDWEESQTLLLKTQGEYVIMNPDGSEINVLKTYSYQKIPAAGYLILRLH